MEDGRRDKGGPGRREGKRRGRGWQDRDGGRGMGGGGSRLGGGVGKPVSHYRFTYSRPRYRVFFTFSLRFDVVLSLDLSFFFIYPGIGFFLF